NTASFSVSAAECRERRYQPPATRIASIAAAATKRMARDLFASTSDDSALTVADDTATGADTDETATAAGADPDAGPKGCGGLCSSAIGTEPELAATARPVSVSRFNRCRSARISAAC